MKNIDEILKEIDQNIDKPFITPVFGNNWKENTKLNYDFDTVIDIAWRQGRKAILLERVLKEILK